DGQAAAGAVRGDVEAERDAVRVVSEVERDLALLRVYLDADPDLAPLRKARDRVMARAAFEAPSRQLAYRLLHRPLGVVEPLADESLDRHQPVPLDDLENPSFPVPAGAAGRQD